MLDGTGGNKSKFKSAEHEIYLMRVDTDNWKKMRAVDGYGNGGDHPEFRDRCLELGEEILR